jgi:hypothetical protein
LALPFPSFSFTGPSLRIPRFGLLVDPGALFQELPVVASMPLDRCDKLQGAMAVAVVVPVLKLKHPGPRCFSR